MKTFNVICCVIFIYCCLDFAVFRIIALTNMNTGIIQKKGLHSSWTNSTMLHKALKQLKSDCDTNDSINFNFEYILEANLSSIMGCFELLCGIFAPRKLHALVTTYDDHDSQMLTQCAGLAGITVIGTSRSVSFQNKKKYPNYNNLFPSLSEEMLILHSLVDSIGVDHFAILCGEDEDSVNIVTSLISTLKTPGSTEHPEKYILFNLTKTNGFISKTHCMHILESIQRLSIKVIVLVSDEKDTEQILQASLEVGLLGRDYMWIGTERVVTFMERVSHRWLPDNMIGMKLRVIPEQTALRAAEILHKLSSQSEISSTPDLCTSGFYSSHDQNLRATVAPPPRNFTYNIIERSINATTSATRFQTTSTWSSLTGLVKSKGFLNRYKAFGSKTKRLRIVTIEHGQYTYQVTKTYPKCSTSVSHCEPHDQTCEIGVPATRYNKTSNDTYTPERICIAGLMIQLLYLFKNDLKFKYDLYIVKDGKYGGVDEATGKWNGMIGDLLDGEADMALATLTTTRKRLKVVDFSYPYGEVGIGLLTAASTDGIKAQINTDFIQPFTPLLWTVIFISIAVVLTLIWILDKVSRAWYLKNRYARVIKRRVYFLESMSFVWSTFVHIPCGSGLPGSESSRFVALFFGFAMVIASASYTAELAARKVKQEVVAPITGIFDEKMQNPPEGFKYATLRDSSTEAFFKYSEDPRMRKIYDNMKENNVLDVEVGVKKLVNGEFQVYIDDRPYLEHLVSSRLNCSLRVVGDSLGTSGYAVALKKNSEWTNPLSLTILKYNENNIIQDLWGKWLKRKCISKDEFNKAPSGLTIEDLNGLFLAILIGIGLGMVALVFENAIHHLRVRRRNGVTISENRGLNISRDGEGVPSEPSENGIRLVSHFSNGGFDETVDGKDICKNGRKM